MQFVTVGSILYVALMAFAKIALMLSFKRLSEERWFQLSIWTTLVVVVAYSIAIILALIFACSPIQKSWDITITSGTCINKGALYLALASFNAATDLVMLVLPIPMVLTLRIPRRQKVVLTCMFTIGSL